MSNYQTPITIKDALTHIQQRNYLLPSIQREFVWGQSQIEVLFDSLMRGYPIGTFLFWRVDKDGINNFQFYEFLKHYHDRDQFHNDKVENLDKESITAILDGQQRLTALYIGLMGTYAAKLPYYRVDNDHAYPKKQLYLNLFYRLTDELEMKYEFKFLTQSEATKESEDCFWFPCHQILELADMSKISMFLMKQGLMDTSKYTESQSEYAIKTLNEFYNIIHQKGTISAYVESDNKLDKVLQIFIRINSGGTKLSYSDLLLSIATAQWTEKDAREEIHCLVDDLNQIGTSINSIPFHFNKDFVLKSCLVLSDLDVKFQVDNFTRENMKIIEGNWKKIRNAIILSVKLISNFGFNGDSLTTYNAVIPIANYIYYNNYDNKFLISSHYQGDRQKIKEWLAKVILKGIFGGTPDAIYPVIRRLIKESPFSFPLESITEHYRGRQRSIIFDMDELDALLELKYNDKKTYSLLMLLYPSINQTFIYHKDHLHPRSHFNKVNYRLLGLTVEDTIFYENYRDRIANIRLLPNTQNLEKRDMTLQAWVEQNFDNQNAIHHFLKQHHLSENVSLDFKDFKEFVLEREKYIKQDLLDILNIKPSL